MKITKELFVEALATLAENCSGDSCLFSEGTAENLEKVRELVAAAKAHGSTLSIGPEIAVFYDGLHVGYRLRQLEEGQ